MYLKPKGTKDLFKNEEIVFSFIERVLIDIASIYNFSRIRTPIFEGRELFIRSVGQDTEIVKKEMYEFEDKKGRQLALKPEGTAPTIRAFIENKLYKPNRDSKFFYLSKMYRYERPQKGRQREFNQFGVEYIGNKSPLKDVELILMADIILESLKIKEYRLEINSLGSFATQKIYVRELKKYFKANIDSLGKNAQRRIETNPLRILDDKKEMTKKYYKNIPLISSYYSPEDKLYFDNVIFILDSLEISYTVNGKLVRGLDYYSDVVFEFIDTKTSAAQNTIIGGGRYENLISELGGPNISGSGFAIGIERLINILPLELLNQILNSTIDVYIANISDDTKLASFTLMQLLRTAAFTTEMNIIPNKLTKLFKESQKFNPKFVIVAASKEMKSGNIIIKNQITKKQDEIKIDDVINYLEKELKGI